MPILEHGFGIDPETAGSINGISRAIAFGEKNKEEFQKRKFKSKNKG